MHILGYEYTSTYKVQNIFDNFINTSIAPPGTPILIPLQNGLQFTEGSTATLLCLTSGGNPPPALWFCKIQLSSRITNVTSCFPTIPPCPWDKTMWDYVNSSFGRVLLGQSTNFSNSTATVTWILSAKDDGALVYCKATSYSHSRQKVFQEISNFTLTVLCIFLLADAIMNYSTVHMMQ